MPVTYEFVGKVVQFTVDGAMANADIRMALERATREPEFCPGMRILLHDLGSTYRPSSEEAFEAAQDLSEMTRKYSPHIAVVVHDEVKYGLGRMIAAYCEREGINFQVFRNFQNAQQWLEYVHEEGDETEDESSAE